MRAEYDTGGDHCTIARVDGARANTELPSPCEHLDLLPLAAERHELDREAILAAARSALEAPDRVVDLDVHARAPGGAWAYPTVTRPAR